MDNNTRVYITLCSIHSPQVDTRVERELLNHRKLSGHQKVVQFKEVRVACCIAG